MAQQVRRSLPGSRRGLDGRTDGRTREDGDGDHLSRRDLGRRATVGACGRQRGAEKDANLIETAVAPSYLAQKQ